MSAEVELLREAAKTMRERAKDATDRAVADWLLEASVEGGISETRCALAVARAFLGRAEQ